MTTDDNHRALDARERIRPEWRCPTYREDEIDWLVWIDDERVRCGRCGTIYNPNWRESDSLED